MARTRCVAFLFGAVIRACLASDAAGNAVGEDLHRAIAELQKLAARQQDRIDDLEDEAQGKPRLPRSLQDSAGAATTTASPTIPFWESPQSIFGAYKLGRRSFTAKESVVTALNHAWLIICGALVMFMQAGFAMVEAGCARTKNVQNVLLKNLVDIVMCTFAWYLFGWSFAFSGMNSEGKKTSGFAGSTEFLGHSFLEARDDGQQEPTDKMAMFFFQWAFCATASTIVSAGVAERANFPGYCYVTFVMTSLVYPCVAGSTWGQGFLSVEYMNDSGYIDFAGSGIVHMTGGIGALVGSIMIGPRVDRFDKTTPLKQRPFTSAKEFEPHSLPLIVLGTFILWFGWYGFNCGATLGMENISTGMLAAQVAMNTTMAASAGGLTVFLTRYAMFKKYDIGGFCNGILAGLVSITAGCGSVETGSAFFIGLFGGLVYQAASSVLRMLMIDDVVDAFPVHGAAGAWGVFAAALFDWGHGFQQVSGWSGFKCIKNERTLQCKGVVDSMGKDLVASNITEIIFIVAWVGVLCTILFLPLRLTDRLRAEDSSSKAFDVYSHGGGLNNDLRKQNSI